jgi:endonuclease-3
MQPARRRAIFRRLQAANPRPTTELLYSSPFELLVAVMLSAHTTDRSVNAATRKLFAVANTPQAIAALGVDGVRPYLKSVGLYNMKSKNLLGLPVSSSRNTQARFPTIARHSRRFRESDARPRTSFST